jgi:peptide-methionine (R)-S-oxide reductase
MRILTIFTLSVAGVVGSCSDMRPDNSTAAASKDVAVPPATQPAEAHADNPDNPERAPAMMDNLPKTNEEWRAILTDEQYRITRLKGTERPFTGAYWDTKAKGTYFCACCGQPLFTSDTKYDAGCGWPSFWAPIDEDNVDTEADTSLGMHRTEIVCSRCGAHLGHVFEDGPNPTGLRYCVNSASLKLVEDEE